jgi:hypothetical protein
MIYEESNTLEASHTLHINGRIKSMCHNASCQKQNGWMLLSALVVSQLINLLAIEIISQPYLRTLFLETAMPFKPTLMTRESVSSIPTYRLIVKVSSIAVLITQVNMGKNNEEGKGASFTFILPVWTN